MAEATASIDCDNLLRCRFHSSREAPSLPVRVVVYTPWGLALRKRDVGAESR